MKQLKSYKTTTFADGDFRIDIVEKRDCFEAWIYRSKYGMKSFIYGQEKQRTTFDEFVELIEDTVDEDKRLYDEEVERNEKAFWDDYNSRPQPEPDPSKRRTVIVRTSDGDIEYLIINDEKAYEWRVPYKLCDAAVEGHLTANVNPRYRYAELGYWTETTIKNVLETCEWNEVLGEKVSA